VGFLFQEGVPRQDIWTSLATVFRDNRSATSFTTSSRMYQTDR